MTQDAIEWLPTAKGNLIGCDNEGRVVHIWDVADSLEVRKAKHFVEVWIAARKYRDTILAGDPKAFGGQAEKDQDVEKATAQVQYFQEKATRAINELYGIS